MSVKVGLYAKAIVSAAVTAATAAISALADGSISGPEWITIVTAFLVAAGAVWAIPNTPESVRKYGKAITAALIAGLASLAVAWTDGGLGLGAAEVLTLLVALLAGSGLVAVVPNAVQSDPIDPETGEIIPVDKNDLDNFVAVYPVEEEVVDDDRDVLEDEPDYTTLVEPNKEDESFDRRPGI